MRAGAPDLAVVESLDEVEALPAVEEGVAVERPFGAARGPLRPHRLGSVRDRLSGPTLARRFRRIDGAVGIFAALVGLDGLGGHALLATPLGVVVPFAMGTLVTLSCLGGSGAYVFPVRERLRRRLGRLAACIALGSATVALASAAPTGWGWWTASTTVSLLVSQALAWALVRRWRRDGRLTPNVVVVGATRNAARLIEAALATRDIAVLGVFDDRLSRAPSTVHGVPVLGDTRALLEHKILPYVDRIVITVSASAQTRVRELIERLRVLPNAVTLFVDVWDEREQAQAISRLTSAPLAQVTGPRLDEARAASKRWQDVLLGTLALVALAPAMLVVAAAVRLEDGGPMLFRQRRYGFNNEPITIVKFRSMRVTATAAASGRQVEPDDPRVTRVGRFIRATSLDELPQIFNVLSGEMSLVGPRPHAIGMLTAGEESNRIVAEYAWRNRMKPGITGWAQINGSRGPVDTPEAVRRRVAMDIDYIERQSLALDLYILLMTLPRLLGDRAAVR